MTSSPKGLKWIPREGLHSLPACPYHIRHRYPSTAVALRSVLRDPNYIVGAGADARVASGALLEVLLIIGPTSAPPSCSSRSSSGRAKRSLSAMPQPDSLNAPLPPFGLSTEIRRSAKSLFLRKLDVGGRPWTRCRCLGSRGREFKSRQPDERRRRIVTPDQNRVHAAAGPSSISLSAGELGQIGLTSSSTLLRRRGPAARGALPRQAPAPGPRLCS